MTPLSIWIAVFLMSLFVLIKSSEYFTHSAEKIGVFLGFPPFIVGVRIVSIGTSLPELIVSTTAAREGKPELAIGNVLGSNIFNASAVVGISAMFGTLVIPETTLSMALPLTLVGNSSLRIHNPG